MSKPIVTFITGNQKKVEHLEHWLGLPVHHHKLDLHEVQSLDIHEVTEHKARQAYEILQAPVLVEDTSLTFTAMGRLPGTFVKWFLEEIGNDGLAKLAASLPHQQAYCTVTYAFCDGKDVQFFGVRTDGSVPPEPRGGGMGWNPVFIPEGETRTFGEMTLDEVEPYSPRAKAIQLLKKFLQERGY